MGRRRDLCNALRAILEVTPTFPALEVLSAPATGDERPLAPGTRWSIPVGELKVALGRSRDCELVLPGSLIGDQHCVIEQLSGRWWVRHLGAPAPTRLNGRRVQDAELRHGDVLELPHGVVFRFLEREVVEVRDPALEAAIAQNPDDDSRWAVYADWLLERGDPLGRRLQSSVPEPLEEAGRWLGTLATHFVSGLVEVTWHHGLPRRVVVRQPHRWLEEPRTPAAVELVLANPLCRFLEELEIDVRSFGTGAFLEAHLELMLAALGRPGGPPGLRVLRLGPLDRHLLTPGHWRLFDDVRAAHHALTTTRDTLCFDARDASLECLAVPGGVTVGLAPGERRRLTGGAARLIGPLEGCPVPGLRLTHEGGSWWLADQRGHPPLRVNGRAVYEVQLRDGDVLEPAPGLLLRFHLE